MTKMKKIIWGAITSSQNMEIGTKLPRESATIKREGCRHRGGTFTHWARCYPRIPPQNNATDPASPLLPLKLHRTMQPTPLPTTPHGITKNNATDAPSPLLVPNFHKTMQPTPFPPTPPEITQGNATEAPLLPLKFHKAMQRTPLPPNPPEIPQNNATDFPPP